jgi:hypothetical protein
MGFETRTEWLQSNDLAISHGMVATFPHVPLDGLLDASSTHIPSPTHPSPNEKLNLEFVGLPGESTEASQTRTVHSYLYSFQHSLTTLSLHLARLQQEMNQLKSIIKTQKEEIAYLKEQQQWCKEWILRKYRTNGNK